MEYDAILWGKSEPLVPLTQHMIAVGACAEAYLNAKSTTGLRQNICRWLELEEKQAVHSICYAFSLHDIGKIHPAFQFRMDGMEKAWENYRADCFGHREDGFRHESYGCELVKKFWNKNRIFTGAANEILAAAISLHHQGKKDTSGQKYISPGWTDIQEDVMTRMQSIFQPIAVTGKVVHQDALGITLSALLILCDWVASSAAFGSCRKSGDEECYAWAVKRARAVLTSYGLIADVCIAFPTDTDFTEFWPKIPRDGMRPLQWVAEKVGKYIAALTIIESPPGDGKTETALYIAGCLCKVLNKHGIYMALPTAATSNQMVGRVRSLMESHGLGDVRLLHANAWLMDEISPESTDFSLDEERDAAAQWLRPLRRGMLSENAVGTVDQAMSSVLWLKYGILRLAGLANKVLIIDEIHAYDVYMSHIIERLLEWCRALNIPVILLSATLQKRQKERYLRCFIGDAPVPEEKSYPLITQVGADGCVRFSPVPGSYMQHTYHFIAKPILNDIPAIAQAALDMAKHGGCICVMLNTVRGAQEVYEELARRGEKEIMLFHARFRMRRRAEIERECLDLFGSGKARPDRMILICTQVVEQSLDLDFDAMITELAPVDLLIQRAGRVFRHANTRRPGDFQRPEIIVATPGTDRPDAPEYRYGVLGLVYAESVLWNTEKWLGHGRKVGIPQDVRECVDSVYADFDDAAMEAFIKKQVMDRASEVHADANIFPSPRDDRFFGRLRSSAQHFVYRDMEDTDVLTCAHGVSTREGSDTRRVVFLPEDFVEDDTLDIRNRQNRLMQESCSIHIVKKVLTNGKENTIMQLDDGTKLVDNQIVLRPDEHGLYHYEGQIFHVDDRIGIWSEKEAEP